MSVGRFDMNTDPSTWPPGGEVDTDAILQRYVASGQFTTDALDWAGIHAHRHADLVIAIEDYFRDSPECAAVIEDIADGVREL